MQPQGHDEMGELERVRRAKGQQADGVRSCVTLKREMLDFFEHVWSGVAGLLSAVQPRASSSHCMGKDTGDRDSVK